MCVCPLAFLDDQADQVHVNPWVNCGTKISCGESWSTSCLPSTVEDLMLTNALLCTRASCLFQRRTWLPGTLAGWVPGGWVSWRSGCWVCCRQSPRSSFPAVWSLSPSCASWNRTGSKQPRGIVPMISRVSLACLPSLLICCINNLTGTRRRRRRRFSWVLFFVFKKEKNS